MESRGAQSALDDVLRPSRAGCRRVVEYRAGVADHGGLELTFFRFGMKKLNA